MATDRIEEAEWRLTKALDTLERTSLAAAKHKEYVEQLETNNNFMKRKAEENELIVIESKGKIETLRESHRRTEMALDEVIAHTERVTVPLGVSKSLALTISRKEEGFHDLAKDVEKLRYENKELLNRIADLQTTKQRSDKRIEMLKQDKLDEEEHELKVAMALKDDLELIRVNTEAQENTIESLQIDLETLREENAYLTERVKKRGIQLEYSHN
jgi:chromosome segregation ATPase